MSLSFGRAPSAILGAALLASAPLRADEPDDAHPHETTRPPAAHPSSPTAEPVYESVVRGAAASPPVQAPEPTRSLLADESSRIPGTLGDPLRAVQSLPGVARPGLVAGDLIVRGASPWDTAVLVDGHPIPHLYHFLQGPAVLDPAFLERVDFHPGGWGVANGGKIGGLVEARTRAPDPHRTRFEFDLDPIDSGLLYSGPSGARSSFGAAVRRSILGEFIPMLTGQSAIPVYYDLQLRNDVRVAVGNDVSILFLGVQDKVEFPVPEGVETVGGPGGKALRDETLYGRILATWTRRVGRLTTSVSPAFGLDHIVVQTGGQDLDYRVRTIRGRSDVAFDAKGGLVLRAGLEADDSHYDFDYALPAFDPFLGEFPSPARDPYVVRNQGQDDILSLGVYGEVEERFGPLTTVVGLRADHYAFPRGRDHGTLDARVRLRLQAMRRLALTGSVGSYHQPPLPRDLSGDFGNPDLRPERAVQTTLGAEVDLGVAALEVEAFQNRSYDQIVGSGSLVERDGEVVWENLENGGLGFARGVEVLLRRPLTQSLAGWVAYTISESERQDCASCDRYLYTFDQTHILHLLLSWRFARDWLAGARWSYVTGNPTWRVTGATFDADTDSYDPKGGGWGDVRMPPFHELDLRLERGFRVGGGTLRAYAEVLNVYDRRNPEFEVWSRDYRRRGWFSGIPIVPALGIGGSF